MDLYTPSRGLTLPTRITATIPSKTFIYDDARALLRKGARCLHNSTLIRELQTEHACHLLKLKVGCDLTLITDVGMRFSVHAFMVSGGPRYLEKQLFSDLTTQQGPPASITLPHECHPILVDRFVTFLYTKDYDSLPPNKSRTAVEIIKLFNNASFIPLYQSSIQDSVRDSAMLTGSPDHKFHLHMYALGEQLQYEALKTVAQTKLMAVLHQTLHQPTLASLGMLADCVNAVFAPQDSPDRLSINEDSALQQAIIVAVLYSEHTTWSTSQIEHFDKYFSEPDHEPQYSTFRAMANEVKIQNEDTLSALRERAQARQSHRQHQRQARTDARYKATAARFALTLDPQSTPSPTPSSTNVLGNMFANEAKRRRDKKTDVRKARAQYNDAFSGGTEDRVQKLHSIGSEGLSTFLGTQEGIHDKGRTSKKVSDDDNDVEVIVGDDAEMEDGMMRMTIDEELGDFLSTMSGA